MTSVAEGIADFRYGMLHLTEGSQHEYQKKLLVFQAWCEGQGLELEGITAKTMRRFVEHLRLRTDPRDGTPISNSTIHGYLRVIRAFLNWLGREDDYEGVVNERVTKRIEMPKIEQTVVEVFSDQQIAALLLACEEGNSPTICVRNRAIVCVLVDTGIRAAELCTLTLDNTFLDPYDSYLKVLGKGSKWREVPLGRQSLAALRRYITRYRHGHRGTTVGDKDEPAVFLSRTSSPLTVAGLEQAISVIGERAGLPPDLCHPHAFRHTFAVRFLEATGDIYRLRRLMGHSSVRITEIYTRAMTDKAVRGGVSILDRMK